MVRTAALALLTLLCAPLTAAQEFRATILGRVSDTTTAIVPGVTVTATNTDTGIAQSAVTNDTGEYVLPALAPGAYRLEAELIGFKKVARLLTLELGTRLTVDLVLEAGDLSEVVTVAASTPLLQTADASRGEVITGRTLVDMPLNGRNAFALAALTPGAGFTARGQASTFLRTTANNGFSAVSISGGQPRANEALLDGVPNTGSDGLIQFVPSVDATQEFKVQTNSFDAEFGRFTGGVINATIKSGANEVRGTVFNFIRDSALNARDFFATSKPAFDYSLFGGSVGGPITVPGLYRGRNRSFFFFNYEGSREDVPRAFLSTVPTDLERQGDFSQTRVRLANGQAAAVTIYDPLTTRLVNGVYVRDPFPGNRIPADRLSPIARQLLDLFPRPNRSGDAVTNANNFGLDFKDPVSDDGFVVRLDHKFNTRHQLFGRYSWRRFNVGRAGNFQNALTGDAEQRDAPGLAFDDTLTISDSTFLNMRYGYSGFDVSSAADPLPLELTALGFSSAYVAQLPVRALPRVAIAGFTTIGAATKRNESSERTHTVRAGLTRLVGRQTWRVGAETRLLQSTSANLGAAASGDFSFNSVFTRGPNPQVADLQGGFSLASFLLGYGASGSVVNNGVFEERGNYYGMFAQNDWRLTDRLTLNLGVRYEWEGPYTSQNDQLNRGFAFGVASPLDAAARAAYAANPIAEVPVSQFGVTGGRLFAGVDGQPRSLTDVDRNNVSPRVGAAYRLTPRTVVRGGYGLFYGATTQLSETRDGFSVTTPWVTSFDGQLTPAATLANPFPDGLASPIGASGGLLTSVGQGISFVNTARRNPYTHQYQVSVQRELPWQTLLDAAYAGSRGRALPVARPINAIPLDQVRRAQEVFAQTGRNVLNDTVGNPFFGLIATGPLAGRTTTRGQLMRPYPQFTSVTMLDDSIGRSSYDALQIKVSRRFADGFSLLASYTGSRSREQLRFLNEQDADPVDEPTAFDTPHVLTVSATVELPVGPGRRWLGQTGGVVGKIVEGWQLNVIYSAASGIPLEFTGAELVGDPALPSGERSVERWFDTAAFRQRQPLEFTQLSRVSSVRSPGRNNVDFSLFKTTRLGGPASLQFRVEAFNLFNRPEFLAPTTAFGNPNFARITALNTFMRQIQFGVKVLW